MDGGGPTDAAAGMAQSPPRDEKGVRTLAEKLASSSGAAHEQSDTLPPDHPVTSKSAHDFSLDQTGLPRYANNTRVMSAVAKRTDIPNDSSTVAVMQTSDSFDKVASWYESQLGATMKETRLDDMQKIANQASPDAMSKMLHSFATGVSKDADTAVTLAPSGPAGPSIAFWQGAPDANHIAKSVSVTSKPGLPTMVVISAAVVQ